MSQYVPGKLNRQVGRCPIFDTNRIPKNVRTGVKDGNLNETWSVNVPEFGTVGEKKRSGPHL